MNLLVDLMVWATFLGAAAFCGSYVHQNWRRTVVGWNVMALMFSIMVVSSLAVAHMMWPGEWEHAQLIRFLAWFVIAAMIWWRVVLVARPPRRKRINEPDRPGNVVGVRGGGTPTNSGGHQPSPLAPNVEGDSVGGAGADSGGGDVLAQGGPE